MLSKDPYSVRDEAAKFRIEIEKYINTQNESQPNGWHFQARQFL